MNGLFSSEAISKYPPPDKYADLNYKVVEVQDFTIDQNKSSLN